MSVCGVYVSVLYLYPWQRDQLITKSKTNVSQYSQESYSWLQPMPGVLCMMLKSNGCACNILSFFKCIQRLNLTFLQQFWPPDHFSSTILKLLSEIISPNYIGQKVASFNCGLVLLADLQSALDHCENLIAATNRWLLILTRLAWTLHINVANGPRHTLEVYGTTLLDWSAYQASNLFPGPPRFNAFPQFYVRYYIIIQKSKHIEVYFCNKYYPLEKFQSNLCCLLVNSLSVLQQTIQMS